MYPAPGTLENVENAEIAVTRQAWKTELTLAVRAEPSNDRSRWLCELLDEQALALELLASRFRPDSEVSAVNRGAGRWIEVSWDFIAVLTACLEAAAATDGLCDPLLGAQVVAAGYDGWAQQESSARAGNSQARYTDIEIAAGRQQARVRIPAGSALDLGAVSKGWLADRLAQIVQASTGWDCLANMGGDLRVCSPARPWVVAAEASDGRTTDLEVQDAGLATSGLGHRRWQGGHHIIDPRTGHPAATCWDNVSVLAATAAGANAAATAGIVLGPDGPAWLDGRGLDGWFTGPGDDAQVGRWRDWREPAPVGA